VGSWRALRSTYKINLELEAEVTYMLTRGGRNAGIVSERGHAGRSYRISTKRSNSHYLDPARFLMELPRKDGSWWPEWIAWLNEHIASVTGGRD
jgi:polyhydroxyalkanoate synthase subunit PhaC